MPEADPRLTLRFDGPKITAGQFSRAVNAFFELLDEVSQEMTGSARAVRWIITLGAGSELVHASPELIEAQRAPVAGLVRGISRGIGLVERRIQRPKHFTDSALRTTRDLASVADGQDVRSIEIQAPDTEGQLSQKAVAHINHLLGEEIEEHGTVEGLLQTLSERHRPHFAIYDPLTDQPIRCNVNEKLLEQAWRAFGQRVAVSGLIRYRKTGQPVSVQAETLYVFPRDEALPTADDVYGILSTVQ